MICFDEASVTTLSATAFWPHCRSFVPLKTVFLSFFYFILFPITEDWNCCSNNGLWIPPRTETSVFWHNFPLSRTFPFSFPPLVWLSFLPCGLRHNAQPTENVVNVAEQSRRSCQAFCRRAVPLRLPCKRSRGRERKLIALLSCDALRSGIRNQGWRDRGRGRRRKWPLLIHLTEVMNIASKADFQNNLFSRHSLLTFVSFFPIWHWIKLCSF